MPHSCIGVSRQEDFGIGAPASSHAAMISLIIGPLSRFVGEPVSMRRPGSRRPFIRVLTG